MTEELQNDTTEAEEMVMPQADHVFITDETESIDSGKIPVWQQLSLLAVLLFLLLGGVITPKVVALFQTDAEAIPAAVPILQSEADLGPQASNTQSAREPFADITIRAEAAFVWDIQNQRALYKKNEQKPLPLASVTKLMTALVAYEILEEQDLVAIEDEAIRQYGNSGLIQGETFERLALTDLMLMSSSNDGAYALAAAAGNTLSTNGANSFVYAMNIRAQELGLYNTSFKNPTGLDISQTESGAEGSAKDMAFLMEHIVTQKPDILTYTTQNDARVYSADGTYHDTQNTNYYINQIPGLIGSKTGYTDLAGGNLVVAFDAGLNRPIVVAVLGSTRNERFTDVITLVEEAQKLVTQN
tara:strand:- start:1497 stop:2570 length:1074 start_codon:yes stop_codon:yes gene_type:complete